MQMCFHFIPEFSNHWTGTWSTLASRWNVNMTVTLLGWSFNNQLMYFGQGSHSLGLQLWSLACHRIHLCHHLGQSMIANDRQSLQMSQFSSNSCQSTFIILVTNTIFTLALARLGWERGNGRMWSKGRQNKQIPFTLRNRRHLGRDKGETLRTWKLTLPGSKRGST